MKSKYCSSRFLSTVISIVLLSMWGCGPKWGALLYHSGLLPKEKIKAEYELPKGSVLILVDDDLGLIQPPIASELLVDELSKELKKNEITNRVTTNEEIARIRQSQKNFDDIPADRVGRLANADTVIWIKIKNFYVSQDLEMNVSPGKLAVEVRVINALADKKEDVRLWPKNRSEGKLIDVTVSPHEIRRCKTLREAHSKLAKEMADKIAKLFYDYEIDPYQ